MTLARLTAQTMPRALGSNRALRITSCSPSILLQPLAADDVGGRYGEAVPYVILPRMIAKAMRAILLASATATSLKGLVCMSFPGSQRVFVRLAMIEDRMRAHDEQFPQISIAHFRDAAQALLAAGRVLSRRQAKKG